jgi:hypothetical protein
MKKKKESILVLQSRNEMRNGKSKANLENVFERSGGED